MIYDIDNRYPEIASPFAKIHGVKRHGSVGNSAGGGGVVGGVAGGVVGGLGFTGSGASAGGTAAAGVSAAARSVAASAQRRAMRINDLKSYVMTFAVAITAVIVLLTGAPEPEPEPEPEPVAPVVFTEPSLHIVSADYSGAEAGTAAAAAEALTYSYRVSLNDAEGMEVSAVVTADGGERLGADGPYSHTASETSPAHSVVLSANAQPRAVTLTLTGTYTEADETKTVTATRTISIPEQPFLTPTLTISSAAYREAQMGTAAAAADALAYSYLVELNSAADMQVSALVTADTGEQLGSDGPYAHSASEVSAERSVPLSWTSRPAAVTLTLTGTYTEKGETKTVTASQTVTLPELPFIAPTLRITGASLADGAATPLTYRYQVTLNSAASMRVSAVVTSETGERLGTLGHYTHDTSGTSPARSVTLSWRSYPERVTLTLTGAYEENGETKTVTARQTLNVPAPPFTAPTLTISSLSLTPDTVSPLHYSYQVTLNSASSMQVSAVVSSETGVQLGTDGPVAHSVSGLSPDRSLPLVWTSYPETVTLTLTGTYTENGVTKTVTAAQTLTTPSSYTPPSFIAPELTITDASIAGYAVTPLNYRYAVQLNSAAELEVSAVVTSDYSETLGSDGPYTHSTGGASPENGIVLSWLTKPGTVTLTLTGTYLEDGSPRTVVAEETIAVPAFTAPSFQNVHLSLNDFEEWANAVCSYGYTLDPGDAAQVTVAAELSTDLDMLSTPPDQVFTSIGSYSDSLHADLSPLTPHIYLNLTGTYQEDGVDKTITASSTIDVTMTPGYFDCGGEGGPDGNFALWVAFEPRGADPHAGSYSFSATVFDVTWFDAMGNSLGRVAAAPVSALVYTEYTGGYQFSYYGPLSVPAGAAKCVFHFTIRDGTTGKTYSCTSYEFVF